MREASDTVSRNKGLLLISARIFALPQVSVSRTVSAPHAGDGVFSVRIENRGDDVRAAVYSEVWPWWVKGWLHEITVTEDGDLRGMPCNEMALTASGPAGRDILRTIVPANSLHYQSSPDFDDSPTLDVDAKNSIHQAHAQVH